MGECICFGTGLHRTTVVGCPVHAPSQDSPEWVPWMLAHSAEFKAGYEVARREAAAVPSQGVDSAAEDEYRMHNARGSDGPCECDNCMAYRSRAVPVPPSP